MNSSSVFRWLGLLALFAAALAHAQPQWLDRIVAVAGQEVVTESELRSSLAQIVKELRTKGATLPPDDVLTKQVLDRLILEKLQTQRAEALGIRIDDVTLDRAVQNIAGENNMTLTQFRESLEKDGISYPAFRDKVRQELAIAQLQRREVDSRVNVSEQEINDLIARQHLDKDSQQEYRVSHILIATPEGATPDQVEAARKKADDIRARAAAGEDFAKLAVSYSNSQQALQGGDLGWRTADQLPTIFASQVRALPLLGVSEVIHSGSGFHIVKLMETRGGKSGPAIMQTHARHILIKNREGKAGEKIPAQLQELRKRILAGADFADLAKRYSEDTGSAVEGGDLGWNAVGAFVPEFEEALAKLKKGEISEPFPSRFGWHIIQLLDRRRSEVSDEQLRSRARDLIARQKREEELELWLRRLRDESFVDYRIGTAKSAS